ncbi:DUF6361 family protein [Luteolibacter flavescens]|uniref:DUF6361 family protein n=1 Tax=Luteolibacter flavescens TaxID=1859460 RepID=A0ABT3FIB9_9BACT|nr:DUF6361 family protein [Luteolibacter flavescens]MCW1883094.1 DUF6361 family protein [Luteolibacter flavescens]
MSLFTWLDYSERDRRKMLEVVDLFKERDTRDELGLGSVRDSFADQLFPGTSTIMTRARYFLLVAWTYHDLEEKKVGSAAIAARGRKAETELIEAIERSEDKDGNIGKYARTALKRLPSSVYWQGLGVWGIRTFRGSLAQYQRSLDRHYSLRLRHGRRSEERDQEHDDLAASNWHGGLIEPPKDFPGTCSLRLSRAEAEYLRERIRLSHPCAGSLLAELAANPRQVNKVDFVWEHPDFASFSLANRNLVNHAQVFSEIMHGAALLYNLILAEQSDWSEGTNDYRDRMEEWAQKVQARMAAFEEWDRTLFWEQAHHGNLRIHPGARDFINAWWDLVLKHQPAKLASLQSARTLIGERERRLKKSLARIDNPRARELWNREAGSAQLEFRWVNSRRILKDIFNGLEASHA